MIPRNIYRKIYRTIKKIAERMGYNLVITQKYKGLGENYELILPSATYAPWLRDNLFNETFQAVENNTLVDKYKCYELWQLVAETTKLRGAIIEIGTWRGGSGVLIAKRAKLVGIKDAVYLCDTFKGIVKANANDSSHKNGDLSDTSEEIVKEVVHKHQLIF